MSGIGAAFTGLNIMAKLSGVKAALSRVPSWVWIALVAIALLAAAYFYHQHVAHQALTRADAAGYARAKAEDKAAIDRLRDHALEVRKAAEDAGAKIAGALKEEHNAKVRSVDAAAADIVRGGPGKAGCGRLDYPVASAAPGRQEPPLGSGADPVAPMPDPGGERFIALPLNDTARLFGQCDINRDEALKWRQADDRQRAAWDRMRAALEKTAPKP